jgi:hypothetical protein
LLVTFLQRVQWRSVVLLGGFHRRNRVAVVVFYSTTLIWGRNIVCLLLGRNQWSGLFVFHCGLHRREKALGPPTDFGPTSGDTKLETTAIVEAGGASDF